MTCRNSIMIVTIHNYEIPMGGMWASEVISDFSNKHIAPFFKSRDYGNDVKKITIIPVLTPYRGYIRPRRPRYIAYEEYKTPFCGEDGQRIIKIIDRWFYFDVLIQGELHDEILVAPNSRKEEILARCVIKSLVNVDQLPKRLKDFDREAFKADMISLFRSLGLIE